MRNHFIFSYSGNKRLEVENLYSKLKLDDIKTIVETNCGTSALSYYISTLHPKQFNYILNDNCEMLIDLYNMLKSVELSSILNDEVNKLVEIFNYYDDEKERQKWWNSLRPTKATKINKYAYLFTMKYGQMQAKMHPPFARIRQLKFFNCEDYAITHFLRTENVECVLGLDNDICDKYKNNEDTLIFLDPPYINTSNMEYENPTMNIYEYLYHSNINNWKAKTFLILENTWLIKLIFARNDISDEYNKLYQGSKKKTTHVVISNILKLPEQTISPIIGA